MSNALAIAATTATLTSILNSGIQTANLSGLLGNITVSALPPDRIEKGDKEISRLNLFMYRVTPNSGWHNAGLPSRDGRGERVSNPLLALDLHYLLSAYGKEDLHAEILLGYGMQLLHEMPVLTRNAIRKVFTPQPGSSLLPIMQRLATAELADQIELIKIGLYPLSTEELSKLWTAFQDQYRPTAAYLATVVLIEWRSSTKSALPVRKANLHVMTLRHPAIDSVEPQMLALAPNAQLTLHGRDLLAPDTTVQFGAGGEQPPDPKASTSERLSVPLPGTLLAGVNTVQVIQRLNLKIGEPPLHKGFESNVAAFIVRPTITKKAAAPTEYDITINTLVDTGNNTRSADVVLKLSPEVGKKQRVELLLNELNAPPPPKVARAYTFLAKSREGDAADTNPEVTFPIKGVVADSYLVRVRVDGAESSVETDANDRYVQPQVTLP